MIPCRADRATAAPLARLLTWGLTLLLGISVLLTPAMPAEHAAAFAWGLPGRDGRAQAPARPSGPADAARSGSPQGALQEVAAPAAVQQLQQALAGRQPRLAILEPADGSLLPAGPWVLRLQVDDWPLVDAGPLGLGPHLLVQIDAGPAIPLVQSRLELPELSPGSHRITVMAARPWGEVVKHPGAYAQIRVHRVAPNPLSLPAPGTPQLLSTAPLDTSPAEPVLLDWLLLDAPLQHLRADDARWRLRVSVNGDSFLVDQATPLWLRGWRRGSNALLLELVDGRGEPLNPPFNSLVHEVRVEAGAARPAWRQTRLSEEELAQLLGAAQTVPTPDASAAPAVPAVPTPQTPQTGPPSPTAPAGPEAASPAAQTPAIAAESPPAASQEPAQPADPDPLPPQTLPPDSSAMPTSPESSDSPQQPRAEEPAATGQNQTSPAPSESGGPDLSPEPASPSLSSPALAAEGTDGAEGDPAPPAGAVEPRPAARDGVNPDGTLVRPDRGGPLAALRARLQR